MKQFGGSFDDWLDLSTGINPWPWPVPARLPDAAWQRLPSVADVEQIAAAARRAYRVARHAAIVVAPGTQALIQWLPRLAAPGAVAIMRPIYEEHVQSWQNAGRAVIETGRLDPLPAVARHAVIVNPNNPDGRVIDRATLARIAGEVQRAGGWLILDESFVDLDPGQSAVDMTAELPVVVLRSFGKFHGLAGIRLGFAIAARPIADRVAEALGPWAVSGPTLAIGRAALGDAEWAAAMRPRLAAQASLLDAVLTAAGLAIVGGTALFRLASHPRAREIHRSLAAQRIWSRRFDWRDDLLRFGLPADQAGLDRLAAALMRATDAHDAVHGTMTGLPSWAAR